MSTVCIYGSSRAGGFSCKVIDKHRFVTVINTIFLNNKGGTGAGALFIEQVDGNIVCVNRIVMFENCVFTTLQPTVLQRLYISLVAELQDLSQE